MPYLLTSSVLRLLEAGNAQLSRLLCQATHSVSWGDAGLVVDLDAFLRHCNSFPGLTEISIDRDTTRTLYKIPQQSLVLPPTLTSLTLDYHSVFTLILPLKLSTLVPRLTSLRLRGGTVDQTTGFSSLDLPPNLETLELSPVGPTAPLDPAFVARLPRSLDSFDLECFLACESTIGGPLSYDWPPSLASFRITTFGRTLLEHLPRTVTSLRLKSLGKPLETTFPPCQIDSTKPPSRVFPWRRFFPRLTEVYLYLASNSPQLDMGLILPTMVLDTVIDSSIVDDFIASGFWDVPSLRHLRAGSSKPYPKFKAILMPKCFWTHLEGQNLSHQFQELGPYIQGTDFTTPHFISQGAMAAQLKNVNRLNLKMDVNGDFEISPSIQAIQCLKDVSVHLLPPKLTYLSCRNLRGSNEDLTFHQERDILPVTLTLLSVRGTLPLLKCPKMLPQSLTNLNVPVRDPNEWTLIAERCFLLKKLRVILQSTWTCQAPLTKISSTSLYAFALDSRIRESSDEGMPHATEFFSTPSIYPTSLERLELDGNPWHASVLAVIPRNLGRLVIEGFCWESTTSVPLSPYPEANGMSKEQIMLCLSPKLRKLVLLGPEAAHAGGQFELPNAEILKHLPRSITHLELHQVIDTREVSKASLSSWLPGQLTYWFVEETNVPTPDLRPVGFFN